MPDPNPLWKVIQHYIDDPKHRYPPKVADLARETGISDQTLSKWKQRPTMPEARFLLVFAHATGISYEVLLRAALEGRGYLPPGSVLTMPEGFDAWLVRNSAEVDELRKSLSQPSDVDSVVVEGEAIPTGDARESADTQSHADRD